MSVFTKGATVTVQLDQADARTLAAYLVDDLNRHRICACERGNHCLACSAEGCLVRRPIAGFITAVRS